MLLSDRGKITYQQDRPLPALPDMHRMKSSDLGSIHLLDLPVLLRSISLYGRNKARVQCATLVINGKSEDCHFAFFHPISSYEIDATREVETQCMEIRVGTLNKQPLHVPTPLGYVVGCAAVSRGADGGELLMEHIVAIIYRATGTIQYTLHQILQKTDIDIPQALGYFIRHVAGVVAAYHAQGVVLRNLDPSQMVVYRQADRLMLCKIMDISEARIVSELDTPSHMRELAHLPAFPAPEQISAPTSYMAQLASVDSYAIAAICADAICASCVHDGTPLPTMFKEQLELQTGLDAPDRVRYQDIRGMPHAFRRWWLEHQTVDMDNGLFQIALGGLHADPGMRMSAMQMLRHVHPGASVSSLKVGTTNSALCSFMFRETPRWWSEHGGDPQKAFPELYHRSSGSINPQQ